MVTAKQSHKARRKEGNQRWGDCTGGRLGVGQNPAVSKLCRTRGGFEEKRTLGWWAFCVQVKEREGPEKETQVS